MLQYEHITNYQQEMGNGYACVLSFCAMMLDRVQFDPLQP